MAVAAPPSVAAAAGAEAVAASQASRANMPRSVDHDLRPGAPSTAQMAAESSEPLLRPFLREDQYGILGRAPQPVGEKVRLGLLALTVLPIKMLGAFLALLSFWLCCRLSFLLPSSVRSDTIAQLGRWHCRTCLWWLGFWRVTWIRVGDEQQQGGGGSGEDGEEGDGAVGIVSNHISWCDILLHMSRSFPAFVARSQTRWLPFVGIISKLMGCLYVDRDASAAAKKGSPSSANIRSGGSSADVVGAACNGSSRNGSNGNGGDSGQPPRVSEAVKQYMTDLAAGKLPHARPLLLFPEGTTTNGRFLLPFKTGAFLAGQPLRPVVIRYGEDRISPAWEMIPAPRHIFLMLCNPLHSVTAFELPVYRPNAAERADPRLYAANVRKLMMDFAGLQDTVATYTDKMAHMRRLKAEYRVS